MILTTKKLPACALKHFLSIKQIASAPSVQGSGYQGVSLNKVFWFFLSEQKMDKNKDGVVTIDEFIESCQKVSNGSKGLSVLLF